MTKRHTYQFCDQPPTRSRGRPAPPCTVCSSTSPTRTRVLSKTSAKPSGSQGTPLTVPKPVRGRMGVVAGMGSPFDMRQLGVFVLGV
jgi:hypothetical protein